MGKLKVYFTEQLLNLFVCLFFFRPLSHIFLVPRAPPLQVTAFNSSVTSILVTWQSISQSTIPGVLLGYVVRYIKANEPDVLNFIEIKHDLNTYRNITNLEPYTLYNISVAGYTRPGAGNFSETQSWTDEGGKSHNAFH